MSLFSLLLGAGAGALVLRAAVRGRHRAWLALRRPTQRESRDVDVPEDHPDPLAKVAHNRLSHRPIRLSEERTWTVDFVELRAVERLRDWKLPPDGYCILFEVRRTAEGRWERKLTGDSFSNELRLLASHLQQRVAEGSGWEAWFLQKRSALQLREWQPLPEALAAWTEEAYGRFTRGYRRWGPLGRPDETMLELWDRGLKYTHGADGRGLKPPPAVAPARQPQQTPPAPQVTHCLRGYDSLQDGKLLEEYPLKGVTPAQLSHLFGPGDEDPLMLAYDYIVLDADVRTKLAGWLGVELNPDVFYFVESVHAPAGERRWVYYPKRPSRPG